MNVKVKYPIGAIVHWHMGEKEYRVIGYEYIHRRGVRYIMMDETDKRSYAYDFELKAKKDERTIGFVIG